MILKRRMGSGILNTTRCRTSMDILNTIKSRIIAEKYKMKSHPNLPWRWHFIYISTICIILYQNHQNIFLVRDVSHTAQSCLDHSGDIFKKLVATQIEENNILIQLHSCLTTNNETEKPSLEEIPNAKDIRKNNRQKS